MRSNISEICSLPLQPDGLAGVYYEGADTDKMPKTTANYYPGDDGTCTNVRVDLFEGLGLMGLFTGSIGEDNPVPSNHPEAARRHPGD